MQYRWMYKAQGVSHTPPVGRILNAFVIAYIAVIVMCVLINNTWFDLNRMYVNFLLNLKKAQEFFEIFNGV